MQLIIYTLNHCKICESRQQVHNLMHQMLESQGIDMMEIMYGNINGERIEPYPEHDQLCRKPDNQMSYTAPVYLLQDGENCAKLADMLDYRTVDKYVNYVLQIADQLPGGEAE